MMNQCKITLKKGGGGRVKEHFPLGMEDNSVNKCVFCYFFSIVSESWLHHRERINFSE